MRSRVSQAQVTPELRRPSTMMAVISLAAVAVMLAALAAHYLAGPPEARLIDLAVYRNAAIALLHGTDIYATPASSLPFTYPPFAALLAIPLALVPLSVAQVLWTATKLACLVWIVFVLSRPLLARLGGWWPAALAALVAACAATVPVRSDVAFGQVNLILMGVIVTDLLVAPQRRTRGAMVGLAGAIKLTPMLFVPYLWLSGSRRAAATAMAACTAGVVIGFIVDPDGSAHYWTGGLLETTRLGNVTDTDNQSLRAVLARAPLSEPWLTLAWAAAALSIGAILMGGAVAASRRGDQASGVVLTGLLTALLSPVAWTHHLVWVLGLMAILISGDGRRVGAALGLWVLVVSELPWLAEARIAAGDGPPQLWRLLQAAIPLTIVALAVTCRPLRQPPHESSARALPQGHGKSI
jgi:alpha-1,2-mannosyltransferase